MKKRVLSLLVVGVLLGTTITGCGGKKTTTTPTVTPKAETPVESVVPETTEEVVEEETTTEVVVEDDGAEIGAVFTGTDLGQLFPNDFIAEASIDTTDNDEIGYFSMAIGKYSEDFLISMLFGAEVEGENMEGTVTIASIDDTMYFSTNIGEEGVEDIKYYKVTGDDSGFSVSDDDFFDEDEYVDEEFTLIEVSDDYKVYEFEEGKLVVDNITGYATELITEDDSFGTMSIYFHEIYGSEDLIDLSLFEGAEEISSEEAGMALMTPLMILMMGGNSDLSISASSDDSDYGFDDTDSELLYDEASDLYYTVSEDGSEYILYSSDSKDANGQIYVSNGEITGHSYFSMSEEFQLEFEARAQIFAESH